MNTGLIHGKLKRRKTMVNKQMYGKTFSSKKEFLKWFEEHEDEIDWAYDVEFSWFWNDEDDE